VTCGAGEGQNFTRLSEEGSGEERGNQKKKKMVGEEEGKRHKGDNPFASLGKSRKHNEENEKKKGSFLLT